MPIYLMGGQGMSMKLSLKYLGFYVSTTRYSSTRKVNQCDDTEARGAYTDIHISCSNSESQDVGSSPSVTTGAWRNHRCSMLIILSEWNTSLACFLQLQQTTSPKTNPRRKGFVCFVWLMLPRPPLAAVKVTSQKTLLVFTGLTTGFALDFRRDLDI